MYVCVAANKILQQQCIPKNIIYVAEESIAYVSRSILSLNRKYVSFFFIKHIFNTCIIFRYMMMFNVLKAL